MRRLRFKVEGAVLLVNEIYPTILGESRSLGRPCAIVRLTGCHRRCTWCDTAHAFRGGRRLAPDAVRAEVAALGLPAVLVTGGEPLLQAEAIPLMAGFLDDGLRVILETSGTVGAEPLASVPAGVRRVVDVKAPGSGIPADQIDWEGIAGLGPDDDLKFVCADRADYEWVRGLIRGEGRLPAGPARILSPVHGRLAPADLAGWILEDRLDARLQVQLHRVLWPDRDRGV